MSSASSASSSSYDAFTKRRDSLDEYELRRREMNKIIDAHKRMTRDDDENKMSSRSARANACDLNGEEFQIVCEELWIDFKTWVNHNKNASDCIDRARKAITMYWKPFWIVVVCLIWFRWYIGSGKDACSYGLGYGVFSFACEVMRYLGEFMFVLLIMIIGLCTGLLPIIVCLCMYEFKDTFPDPEEDEDEDEDVGDDVDTGDYGHLKKE